MLFIVMRKSSSTEDVYRRSMRSAPWCNVAPLPMGEDEWAGVNVHLPARVAAARW